jgi:hypothetical protein
LGEDAKAADKKHFHIHAYKHFLLCLLLSNSVKNVNEQEKNEREF